LCFDKVFDVECLGELGVTTSQVAICQVAMCEWLLSLLFSTYESQGTAPGSGYFPPVQDAVALVCMLFRATLFCVLDERIARMVHEAF